MTQTELTVWAVTAITATALDVTMYRRRITGKMGERVRTHYQAATSSTNGGTYTLAACALFFDILFPPIGLAVFWFAWNRDRHWHQDELKARQRA